VKLEDDVIFDKVSFWDLRWAISVLKRLSNGHSTVNEISLPVSSLYSTYFLNSWLSLGSIMFL